MTPTRVFYNFLRIIYVTYVFSYLWEINIYIYIGVGIDRYILFVLKWSYRTRTSFKGKQQGNQNKNSCLHGLCFSGYNLFECVCVRHSLSAFYTSLYTYVVYIYIQIYLLRILNFWEFSCFNTYIRHHTFSQVSSRDRQQCL